MQLKTICLNVHFKRHDVQNFSYRHSSSWRIKHCDNSETEGHLAGSCFECVTLIPIRDLQV